MWYFVATKTIAKNQDGTFVSCGCYSGFSAKKKRGENLLNNVECSKFELFSFVNFHVHLQWQIKIFILIEICRPFKQHVHSRSIQDFPWSRICFRIKCRHVMQCNSSLFNFSFVINASTNQEYIFPFSIYEVRTVYGVRCIVYIIHFMWYL